MTTTNIEKFLNHTFIHPQIIHTCDQLTYTLYISWALGDLSFQLILLTPRCWDLQGHLRVQQGDHFVGVACCHFHALAVVTLESWHGIIGFGRCYSSIPMTSSQLDCPETARPQSNVICAKLLPIAFHSSCAAYTSVWFLPAIWNFLEQIEAEQHGKRTSPSKAKEHPMRSCQNSRLYHFHSFAGPAPACWKYQHHQKCCFRNFRVHLK